MTDTYDWTRLLADLESRGWQARVVPAERLALLRERVEGELSSGRLAAGTAARIAADFGWAPDDDAAAGGVGPAGGPPARSVIIGAKARPLTQAALAVGGERHVVVTAR